MYLHAGNNKIIREKDIIGIFDMDNATMRPDTRAFLKRKQSENRLDISRQEIPKSFILYQKNKKDTSAVCISQLSTIALCNRIRKDETV